MYSAKGKNWACCAHEAIRKNIVAVSGSCKEVHPTSSRTPGRERPREPKALTQAQAADLELGPGKRNPGFFLLQHLTVGNSWR